MQTRTLFCPRCRERKPPEDFYGGKAPCKPCKTQYQRERRYRPDNERRCRQCGAEMPLTGRLGRPPALCQGCSA